METTTRTFAKAITWQALGLLVMIGITYAITGSVAEGGLIAISSAVVGMITFMLHERLWARVLWGRDDGPQQPVCTG